MTNVAVKVLIRRSQETYAEASRSRNVATCEKNRVASNRKMKLNLCKVSIWRETRRETLEKTHDGGSFPKRTELLGNFETPIAQP